MLVYLSYLFYHHYCIIYVEKCYYCCFCCTYCCLLVFLFMHEFVLFLYFVSYFILISLFCVCLIMADLISNGFQWLPLNFDYSASASAEDMPREGGII